MINFIDKVYTFFWRDFLCRLEPFTYQFRRMATKWTWIWIIGLSLGAIVYVIWLVYRCATNKWFWMILFSIITIFAFWLSFHLGGFV